MSVRSAVSVVAWLLILAVCGCQSTPGEGDAVQDGTGVDQAADRAARQQLDLLEQQIARAQWQAAAQTLGAVDANRLKPRAAARYLLARARVALQRGDLEDAKLSLLALDAELLPDPGAAAALAARVEAGDSDPAAAAAALMASQIRGEAGSELNEEIWRLLGQTPPLDVLHRAARASGTARGWWLLQAQMLQSFTLADQQRRLEAWRGSWPDHPAAQRPPAELERLASARSNVRRVALLLPVTGPLSRAGRALRDGYVASYLEHRDDVALELRFYDSGAEPAAVLYERALTHGADLIIGPLAKPAVAEINALDPAIPVLALNYLDAAAAPAANLLQLGLAIEDEALTLAELLRQRGGGRVLMFHNREEWAERAARQLAEAWDGPLTVRPLDSIRTVTEDVGVAMNVAASHARRNELQELLRRDLEFLPRARSDLGAIVALVSAVEAAALVPALRYHFADQVPVYATSQTIRGQGAAELRPLGGFRVSELPWLVGDDPGYQRLDAAFGMAGNPFSSLYALGVDAFRVTDRIEHLRDGTVTRLLGSSGALTLTAEGRLQRTLALGVLRKGRVVPLPPAAVGAPTTVGGAD